MRTYLIVLITLLALDAVAKVWKLCVDDISRTRSMVAWDSLANFAMAGWGIWVLAGAS